MRTDLTDIVIVMDRSGSMMSCRKDAEGGINQFVVDQRKEPGEARLTLVQFDTIYEVIHNGLPLADVPHINLVPRGNTALLDAVGKAIAETGERLSHLEDSARPGLVVLVIVTDGEENSSKEYTKAQIKAAIEHQREVYKWQFVFIGANQDAFAEAQAIGIPMTSAANYTPQNVLHAYASTSANVGRMRSALMSGTGISNFFSDEEREDMEKDNQ